MGEVDIPKKQLILEAAARLFRDRGYAATSMRDLAKVVHLQASSLYNHISSKQEILREICFQNAHHFLAGIENIEQQYTSPAEQLQQLIQHHLTVATSDATSITSFNDEWRHLEEPYLSEFIALRKSYENRFKGIIQAGIQQGIFQDTDPTIAMYTVLSSLRWIYDWYQPGRSKSVATIGQEVSNIILSGLNK